MGVLADILALPLTALQQMVAPGHGQFGFFAGCAKRLAGLQGGPQSLRWYPG
jgi:hypothetical protein